MWRLVPFGLLLVGLAWLGWNIDTLEPNEVGIAGTIIDVEANAPTVQFFDLDWETRTVVGASEDRPPRIGDSREVVVTTDETAAPRLRNANPRWLVAIFGLVGLLMVFSPLLFGIWRFVFGGGSLLGGLWLAKRASALDPAPGSGANQPGSDLDALKNATFAEYGDDSSGLRQAGKEAAGAVLITEGLVGIENPFSSRTRGGLYSSAIGVLAGVGLLLFAPVVGALVTGEADDVRVDGFAVEWVENTRTNDEGERVTTFAPVYSYTEPTTGIEYLNQGSSQRNAPGQIGEVATIAFAADNPGSSIVVQPWGQWVRPGLSVIAGIIIFTSLVTVAIRSAALFVGVRMLSGGKAERRAQGDTRSTFAVIRDSASDIVQSTEAAMPPTARGSVLSSLVAIRREGSQGGTIRAAKDVVGATVLADSLFGLERPFDGENTRFGIFGNAFVVAFGVLLIFGGIWLSNQRGYVGDRVTAQAQVVAVDGFGLATIEYQDHSGGTWSVVENQSENRLAGQQVQVVFDPDTPEVAVVASRGAAALRWLMTGTGILVVLALFPKVLMQAAGIVLGLGLLVSGRQSQSI